MTCLHQDQWIIEDTDWITGDEEQELIFPSADEVLTDTDTDASTAARILVDTESDSEESTRSPTCLSYSPIRTIDPTMFLSGLIKIMWNEIRILWANHQEKLHDTSNITSNPHRTELQQRIRILHALRGHTRTIHQATYFYSDLDTFLAQGTLYQFQSYIDKYKPVILESIVLQHILTNEQPTTSTIQPDPTQHPALEEAPHRKRNRRKQQASVNNPITNYFGPLASS